MTMAAAAPLAPAAATVCCGRRYRNHHDIGRPGDGVDGSDRADALDFSIMRVDHMNRSGKSGGHDVGDHMPADRAFTRARTDDGERARRDQPVQAICRHRRILSESNGLRRAGEHRPYPEIAFRQRCVGVQPIIRQRRARWGHPAAAAPALRFQKTSASNPLQVAIQPCRRFDDAADLLPGSRRRSDDAELLGRPRQ
jgi:hypothetical protein